jgi:hypothetical protein
LISRLIVIVLAFGAAAYRASEGAWVESGGLAALGAGLAVLRFLPKLRWLAVLAFAMTAVSILVVLMRRVS